MPCNCDVDLKKNSGEYCKLCWDIHIKQERWKKNQKEYNLQIPVLPINLFIYAQSFPACS